MSIFEYDQEKHMQLVKEENWEDGHAEGLKEGLKEGQDRMLLLLDYMEKNNEMHLVSKLQDKVFLAQMYEKYQL